MINKNNNLIHFMTRKEISEITSSLARQVESDYQGKEVVIVCPLKGSFIFVADFCRELKLKQKIDFVYMISQQRGGAIKIFKDISLNFYQQHVLIVEEITESGRVLSFLVDRLLACQPSSLKILSLLDKPSRRDLPIKIDYVGKIVDDRFLVGYGMDNEELGRNYSDIYFLKN